MNTIVTVKCASCSTVQNRDVRSPDNTSDGWHWECESCDSLLPFTDEHWELHELDFAERMANQTTLERELQIQRVAAVLIPLATDYNNWVDEQLQSNGIN